MADFKTAYAHVMDIEGGYANDPDDTGGETYKGVSRKNFPRWKGWGIVDLIKRANPAKKGEQLNAPLGANVELQTLVADFYKTEFWDVLKLDYIKSQAIAVELFDTGVNCGTGIAALFLQQAINVTNRNGIDYADIKEDAVIGAATANTLNTHPRPGDVLKVLNVLQGARYIDICRANKKQEKFFRSWFSRVAI